MKKKLMILLSGVMVLSGCSVPNNSNEIIQIDENLSELVVTYPDGLTETIMDPTFLSMFKEGINNQLVPTEINEAVYELIYSVDIDGKSYDCFDLSSLNSLYNTGVIKINNQYYKKESVSTTAENMFNIIKFAHILNDGSMDIQYKKEEIATSIDELFSNISIASEELGYRYNGRYSYTPVNGNTTGAFYDLDLNEYRLSFLDNRTMTKNEISYSWTTRIATLDSCEYDRNNQQYSNCTQYEKDWIQVAIDSFLACNGYYMEEPVFIELESQYEIRSNKPDINFEKVDKIDIMSIEGSQVTITDKTYIDSLINIINHKLIETDNESSQTQTHTLIINGVEIPMYLETSYGFNSFLINNYFYTLDRNYASYEEAKIIYMLDYALALVNGSNDHSYAHTNKVNTIDQLFRNVRKISDERIVLNSEILGSGGITNGTTTIYDFNLKQYQFSFLNNETMKISVIIYNWMDRNASLDSCEYNRNSDIYTNCSEYQQAWIQATMDTFLVSYGNYMDESDFLAQEDSFVFERK